MALACLEKMGFGLILVPLSIGLLVWNEGHYIQQRKAFAEGLAVTTDLQEDVSKINPDLDGKLIHFSGLAESDKGIYDTTFGVGSTSSTNTNDATSSGDRFLKIQRNVEMYQWYETVNDSDRHKHCAYSQQWREYRIRSESFQCDPWGHQNPEMLFEKQSFVADDIHVGAFRFSGKIVSKLKWWRSLPHGLVVDSILDASVRRRARVWGDAYYLGWGTPTFPTVGDTRVSFKVVPSQVISVLAKQTGSGLSSYTSKSGGSFLLLEAGYHSPSDMLWHAHRNLEALAWLLRFLGWILVCSAFHTMMEPLSDFSSSIPIVGNLVEAGNWALSMLLGTTFAAVAIIIAWFAFRPWLSTVLLVVLGVGWWITGTYSRRLKEHRHDQDHEHYEYHQPTDTTPLAPVIPEAEAVPVGTSYQDVPEAHAVLEEPSQKHLAPN